MRRRAFTRGGKYLTALLLSSIVFSVAWLLRTEMVRAQRDAQCDALWSSAESGDNASVRQFLGDGVSPNCQGGRPLQYAIRGGHQDTVLLLKKAGGR